jgi:hypothetical protein
MHQGGTCWVSFNAGSSELLPAESKQSAYVWQPFYRRSGGFIGPIAAATSSMISLAV